MEKVFMHTRASDRRVVLSEVNCATRREMAHNTTKADKREIPAALAGLNVHKYVVMVVLVF